MERLARGRLPAVVLFVLACALYGRTVQHGFVFDDHDYVVDNPLLAQPVSASIGAAFRTIHSANWHPLTWLSHRLDVALFGMEPGLHHAVNVLLHALNGVLLLAALRALTREALPSFLVALLFVVHPLRVESVAWISERKDLLAGTFAFLTLLGYARYVERPSPGRYAAVLLAYVAGCLAKPTVVTLWCVLLLLDVWPLHRLGRGAVLRVLAEKVPLVLVAAALAAVTIVSQAEFRAVASEAEFPPGVRALNALAAYGFYLEKTAWPTGLACFYPHAALVAADPVAALRGPALAGAWALLGGLVLGAFLVRRLGVRRHGAVLVGWLIFAGMLVPMLGWIQVGRQAWADRYAYLPLIGVYVAVCWPLASGLASGRVVARVLTPLLLIACVALGLVTFRLTTYWRNDETLFRRALAVTEKNFVAHDNLGYLCLQRGELDEAEAHLEAALALQPHDVQVHRNLSDLRARQGDLERALAHAEAAARGDPSDPSVFLRIAQFRAEFGRVAEAEAALSSALELDPDAVDAIFNLAVLANRRGDAGRAEQLFRELLARDSEHVDALRGLADVCLRGGRAVEASELLLRARALAPAQAPVHLELALALRRQGDVAGALEAYREALRLDPEQLRAANGLALLLATAAEARLRDGPRARELARVWAERTGHRHPAVLETLAAACAEVGDYEAAREWQRRAIALLANEPQALAAARARLELYTAGRPLRLP